MKLSSGDQQLGLALSLQRATSQSGRTNHPSENERAGCKSPHPHLSEGPGEVFFLHILFHRMSVIGMLRQLRAIKLVSGPLGTQTSKQPKESQLRRDLKTDPALFLSQNIPEVAQEAAAE
jgi:hypothetical protein